VHRKVWWIRAFVSCSYRNRKYLNYIIENNEHIWTGCPVCDLNDVWKENPHLPYTLVLSIISHLTLKLHVSMAIFSQAVCYLRERERGREREREKGRVERGRNGESKSERERMTYVRAKRIQMHMQHKASVDLKMKYMTWI